MKGYKAFNKDWTCRGKQYKVGETFEEDVQLIPCESGMHFCELLPNVFNFYTFDPDQTVVAEVEALGDVKTDDDIKFCTNKLLIIRELSWDEVQKGCNTGNWNTGDWNTGDWNTGNRNTGGCNTGDWNTGDWNTGDWNTGDWNTGNRNTGGRNTGDRNTGNRNTGNRNTGNRNTGDWNTGDCNTGDCNTGDCNTGDCNTGNRNTGGCNTGDWNTGDWNTGNRNTGDWNTGDWNTGDCNTGNRNTGDWNTGDWNTGDWNNAFGSSGCFNTDEPKIMMFNRLSDWTLKDWLNSRARCYLNEIPKNVIEWVYPKDMTDEEKAEHPTYKTVGGYLKVLDEADCAQIWWDGAEQYKKDEIMNLPNFDTEIFRQCTGIRIERKVET